MQDFQQSFLGSVVEVSDSDYPGYPGKQASLRKRADNDTCAWNPPPPEVTTVSDPLMQPTPLPSGIGNITPPILLADNTANVPESLPIGDATSTSTYELVAATAVLGKAFDEGRFCLDECHSVFRKCTVDSEPGAKCRRRSVQTCAAVIQGTQARHYGGLNYSLDDLWGCLAQAQGERQLGQGQPAGNPPLQELCLPQHPCIHGAIAAAPLHQQARTLYRLLQPFFASDSVPSFTNINFAP
ncbi:MAG: hypothetical protein L6R40_007861 [Gallowayella cf. fulva]|nr:MAG: hypothetical protein L6R40_007861 [Xanthomendoza cf. fulva]